MTAADEQGGDDDGWTGDFAARDDDASSGVQEEYLKEVVLSDDNKTILLNGELRFSINLPLNMMSNRKLYTTRWDTLEKLIYNSCAQFGIDYVSQDNVTKLAKEVLNTLIERRRAIKAEKERRKKKEEGYDDGENNISSDTVGTAAQLADDDVGEQQQPQIVVELKPELTRELSFDETADILSVSIKKDRPNKLITFNGMLLAQTNKDQLNVGYQSESSTGKSYIAYEVSSYFPPKEVLKIASASPTAFYHKGGVWDEKWKAQVCDLEHKIVIFADQPHFQLLEKMRSVLSKDDKELTYWITDKSKSGANRTKTIIIKGFASFFFCTAKTDPDEQEKTRLILLSPEIGELKLKQSLELAALRNADTDVFSQLIEQDPKRMWLRNRILAIRQTGIREIIIPDRGKPVFDRFISEHKHLIARHQRDLPRIFGFIKAHALLNCFNRERLVNGKSGTIIATQADIDAGFALYKEIEESNELGLSPYIYRIYTEVIEPKLDPIKGLSRKDIRSKYFSVFHKSLSTKFEDAIIQQLEAAGLVQKEPDPEDRRKMLVYPASAAAAAAASEEDVSPTTVSTVQNSDFSITSTSSESTEQLQLLPPPTVSGDISPVEAIEETLRKVVVDAEGKKKDYFTKDDFVYALVMRPKQEGWSQDKSEQTFYTLIEEGKLVEIETGKFNPSDGEA
jgi:hypothetical protein